MFVPEYHRSYFLNEDNPLLAAKNSPSSPQSVLLREAEKCPVARHSAGTTLFRFNDTIALTRRTDILGEGAPGPAMGSPRPNVPLDFDGPEHRKYRRVLNPLFAPEAIAYLEPAIRHLTNELIDGFNDADHVDVFERLCVPLPCSTFLTIAGLPLADLPLLYGLKERIQRPQLFTSTDDEAVGFLKVAANEAMAYLDTKLTEREAQPPGHDLLSVLPRLKINDEPMARDDVLSVMWLFMIAGLDTVTASLAGMFAWLADHPEERRRLSEEPGVIPAAVEELMRFLSPVTVADRWPTQDIEVGRSKIKAGDHIDVVWSAANLDPEVFPDPLKVDFDAREARTSRSEAVSIGASGRIWRGWRCASSLRSSTVVFRTINSSRTTGRDGRGTRIGTPTTCHSNSGGRPPPHRLLSRMGATDALGSEVLLRCARE